MKQKHRSSPGREMPAGTKLFKKCLKSRFGMHSWREQFEAAKIKPIRKKRLGRKGFGKLRAALSAGRKSHDQASGVS